METPVRIEVESGQRVTLTWEDGSESEISAERLRAACQCASCREPAGAEATRRVLDGDAPITIEDAATVGNYALSFVFGPDHHGTGIYPYSALRTLGADAGG